MRLIDADELKEKVKKWLPSDPCGKEEKEFPFETDICVSMLMEIDEAPTVVEMVRCRDCKYNNDCDIQFAAQAGDGFYCCYGKRKDGEHE